SPLVPQNGKVTLGEQVDPGSSATLQAKSFVPAAYASLSPFLQETGIEIAEFAKAGGQSGYLLAATIVRKPQNFDAHVYGTVHVIGNVNGNVDEFHIQNGKIDGTLHLPG